MHADESTWTTTDPLDISTLPQENDRYLDRELSWLAFNERVLELAEDPSLPLLERVRFCSIFARNLDEFFMVRVAGLKRRIATGLAVPTPAGLSPRQVLDLIMKRANLLQLRHAAVFGTGLRPALEAEGIALVGMNQISDDQLKRLTDYFTTLVFPILTPLAVDPAHPFPYISGLSLNLAITLENPSSGKRHFARIKVPDSLPAFIPVGEDEARTGQFVPLVDLIADNLDRLFPGMVVLNHSTFRVTRNEDLEVEEDDAENLLQALERELLRRRFGPPVRLEIAESMDDEIRDLLVREMGVRQAEVFLLPAPLDLRRADMLADLDRPELHYPAFRSVTHRHLAEAESSKPSNILAAMRQRDILLHHPYDSFTTSVVEFIEQAASDPYVLAIKQTLYRTSGDSPIVDALIDAAEAGKQVLAVVEIKARFDEQANITWARKLEQAGVHVVYGIVGLKTHAKLCLVVRQEGAQLRRYSHIGTGNYNPRTARHYEDFGLLTCDPTVGEDLTKLFNQLSGYAPKTAYSRLLVAPHSLRDGLIDLIDQEIAHAEAGRSSGIRMKMNSIVDEAIIDALYRASAAGVQVDLLVRGICSLRPGVPGLSENITVRSVLGRFLEHSRVFWFANDGSPVVLLGSADMMHRNLDRRVEALLHITTAAHVQELQDFMEAAMSDKTRAWHLASDGLWTRAELSEDCELRDLQSSLIDQHANLRTGTNR